MERYPRWLATSAASNVECKNLTPVTDDPAEIKRLVRKTKTDMKQTASGWVILTRKLVAGFHPQNDTSHRPLG